MAKQRNGRVPEDKTPRYLRRLTLQNLRCFGGESQELCFCKPDGTPSQWTVLIGNNGTGKTTLLECLISFGRVELLPELTEFTLGTRLVNWTRAERDVHFLRVGAREWAMMLDTEWGIKLSAANREPHRGAFSMAGRDEPVTGVPRIIKWKPNEKNESPIIYAYGAARRVGTTALADDGADDATASLVDESASLRNAEEWLLKLDYSASKQSEISESQRRRFELVRHLLIELLPEVSDIRITVPSKSRPQPAVEFKTLDGWMPLKWIGYGYRTLIAWMVDFASRMVERYPRHRDPLSQPAVVLVDEIDLHLHPKWQRTLMTYLSDRFPNTQFVVTAHSPIFVQAATGANIVLLRRDQEKGHVVIDNNPEAVSGWRLDQLLTSDLFGFETARPPDVEPLLIERKKLLAKPKLNKRDKARLQELDREIGRLPSGETLDDSRRMEQLARNLDVLEKHLENKD